MTQASDFKGGQRKVGMREEIKKGEQLETAYTD